MQNLKQLFKAARYYGPARLAFRLKYEYLLRSGLLVKKFPAHTWAQRPLTFWLKPQCPSSPTEYKHYRSASCDSAFFFSAEQIRRFNLPDTGGTIAKANDILAGTVTYFSGLQAEFKGCPDWLVNPFTGQKCPQHHWTKIPDFGAGQGDIKFIWEPSRFSWVYPLVRAYAATGNDKYVEHFWRWFEDWLKENPPNIGPNYKCGQECAIRVMAVCFAFFAFLDSKAATADRVAAAVTFLAVHGQRIASNIAYARYQNNNHAISEANGLYTIGILFPELKCSQRWRSLGKKVLEESAAKQIFPDGSYIQNSMNYHRLMLHNYLWALRLAEINSDTFSQQLRDRVLSATDFLYQVQDPASGSLPNYGANDGTLLIPLNNCDYLDYRPVINASNSLLRGKRCYGPGPWDEDLLWLFGTDPAAEFSAPPRRSSAFEAGGYYTMRCDNSWLMTRCHTFKTKPSHADMLSVDLWRSGTNLIRDSGSFSYNCQGPWQEFFRSTLAHSTVVVNNSSQMSKASRFMWLDWVGSELIAHAEFDNGKIQIFQGRHYGYNFANRNIVHQRSILSRHGLCWLIVDDIIGTGTCDVDVTWQLANLDYTWAANIVEMKTAQGPFCLTVGLADGSGTCRVLTGDPDRPQGWQSLYYGQRQPAPTYLFSRSGQMPARFFSLISLEHPIKIVSIESDTDIRWNFHGQSCDYSLTLRPISHSPEIVFTTFKEDSRAFALKPN
jgi:hypothetical protein